MQPFRYRPSHGTAEKGLDRASDLQQERHSVRYRSPFVTSGVRLGTPAGTTRGLAPAGFRKIGGLIAEAVEGLAKNGDEGDVQVEASVRRRVGELCAAFPVYLGDELAALSLVGHPEDLLSAGQSGRSIPGSVEGTLDRLENEIEILLRNAVGRHHVYSVAKRTQKHVLLAKQR